MHPQPLASLFVLLAACSSPALCGGCGDGGMGDDAPESLPESFRVEAEIVSVEPGPGLGQASADLCTPTTADIDPAGPDWSLAFDRMHDADEPTFKEWTTSENGDSAARCQRIGDGNCCDPLAATADGWSLECDGDSGELSRNRFAFTFKTDGSGSSTTTRTNAMTSGVVCVARASWTALIAD